MYCIHLSFPLIYSFPTSVFLFSSFIPVILSIINASTSLLITSSALSHFPSSPCFHPSCPFCLPPFVSRSLSTALFSADVWCRSCGCGGGQGIEPQSGNWSKAPELHLASDLATRDQPHELSSHGKCPTWIPCEYCLQCMLSHSYDLLHTNRHRQLGKHVCCDGEMSD